ncbi:hypothetical protein PROFUN_15365 [Planoprotostelium fungivorum]|uniref:RBR-type E3 ubiquitin transferase n=1 Tax=Planoprotostelium fungivorum TaxID=1890364 RepID=A0A2P6MW21_9EUKA|nr:hypothetical protein PROFUN_15365 [Planoprotostelium fungivorum]
MSQRQDIQKAFEHAVRQLAPAFPLIQPKDLIKTIRENHMNIDKATEALRILSLHIESQKKPATLTPLEHIRKAVPGATEEKILQALESNGDNIDMSILTLLNTARPRRKMEDEDEDDAGSYFGAVQSSNAVEGEVYEEDKTVVSMQEIFPEWSHHEAGLQIVMPQVVRDIEFDTPEYGAELKTFLQRMEEEEKEHGYGKIITSRKALSNLKATFTFTREQYDIIHSAGRTEMDHEGPKDTVSMGELPVDRLDTLSMGELQPVEGQKEKSEGVDVTDLEQIRVEEVTSLSRIFGHHFLRSDAKSSQFSVMLSNDMMIAFDLPSNYPSRSPSVQLRPLPSCSCTPQIIEQMRKLNQEKVNHNPKSSTQITQMQQRSGRPQLLDIITDVQAWLSSLPKRQENKSTKRDPFTLISPHPYDVVTVSQIGSVPDDLTSRFEEETGLKDKRVCRQILKHYKWNLRGAVEAYKAAEREGGMDHFLKGAKVVRTEEREMEEEGESECSGEKREEGTRMRCGHFFCRECCSSYLNVQISEGMTWNRLKCPGYKCEMMMDVATIASTAISDDTWRKLCEFSQQEFVDEAEEYRWCVTKNCGKVIHSTKARVMIHCTCHNVYCFACGADYHWPATCEQNAWYQKQYSSGKVSSTIAEDEAFIRRFTRPCPECRAPIEKDGGCNHMSCKKCHAQFCWVCMGAWTGGSHYLCSDGTGSGQNNSLEDKMVDNTLDLSFSQIRLVHGTYQNRDDPQLRRVIEKIASVCRRNTPTPQMVQNCSVVITAVEIVHVCRQIIFNLCLMGEYFEKHFTGKAANRLKAAIADLQGNINLVFSVTDCPVKSLDFRRIENATRTICNKIVTIPQLVVSVFSGAKKRQGKRILPRTE